MAAKLSDTPTATSDAMVFACALSCMLGWQGSPRLAAGTPCVQQKGTVFVLPWLATSLHRFCQRFVLVRIGYPKARDMPTILGCWSRCAAQSLHNHTIPDAVCDSVVCMDAGSDWDRSDLAIPMGLLSGFRRWSQDLCGSSGACSSAVLCSRGFSISGSQFLMFRCARHCRRRTVVPSPRPLGALVRCGLTCRSAM